MPWTPITAMALMWKAAWWAGYDARHMTMGPGVYASHGYERTHISALEQTFQCIRFYLEK